MPQKREKATVHTPNLQFLSFAASLSEFLIFIAVGPRNFLCLISHTPRFKKPEFTLQEDSKKSVQDPPYFPQSGLRYPNFPRFQRNRRPAAETAAEEKAQAAEEAAEAAENQAEEPLAEKKVENETTLAPAAVPAN